LPRQGQDCTSTTTSPSPATWCSGTPFEGIVSKRLGSPYVSGRSRNWLKFENPAAPAVKREAEEDWGR